MPPLRCIVLTCCGFIAACVGTPRRNVPPHYAQSVAVDSLSSTCTRNPAACYAPLPGEEALLPWASRSVQAVRTISSTLRLLEAADVARVESTLSQYMKDPATGQWRWLDPKQVAQWVREGLTSLLRGTLIPDVVLHASGNPNKVQAVYDFKFPCAPAGGRQPAWRVYLEGHPHFPKNQRQMYAELGGLYDPAMVTPLLGILR